MFKIGDRVKVLDINLNRKSDISIGNIYTICNLHTHGVYLEGVSGWWNTYRFELVKEEEPKKYIVVSGYWCVIRDNLESAIEAVKSKDGLADIYELGRKLEKKITTTWE